MGLDIFYDLHAPKHWSNDEVRSVVERARKFATTLGFAKVTKDVTFAVGGTDVTSQLTTLGVQLGSDLSGEFNKPMVTVGGGVDWPFWRQIVVGLQFRFSHIGAEDDTTSALNIGRAGASVGIRF